jgi:hypothetical protein
MGSKDKNQCESCTNLEERKQRRANMQQRLAVALIIKPMPAVTRYDFKAFPQYMLSTSLVSEYVQERLIGAVKTR